MPAGTDIAQQACVVRWVRVARHFVSELSHIPVNLFFREKNPEGGWYHNKESLVGDLRGGDPDNDD